MRKVPCPRLLLWVPLSVLVGCAGRQNPSALPDYDAPLLGPNEYGEDPLNRRAKLETPGPLSEEAPAPAAPPAEPPRARSKAAPPAPPPPAAAAEPDEEPAPAGYAAAKKPRPGYAGARGAIPRRDLLQFLDRNPAAFLRSVDSEPRFEAGRFRGWRIVSLFPGDPRFTDIDVHSGDVVTRVNGLPIEQPDQFIAVWQELRTAHELRVELLRNGRPRIARWTIID